MGQSTPLHTIPQTATLKAPTPGSSLTIVDRENVSPDSNTLAGYWSQQLLINENSGQIEKN